MWRSTCGNPEPGQHATDHFERRAELQPEGARFSVVGAHGKLTANAQASAERVNLQHGGREATFVKHLVNMCGELNVRTLAEMVETPEAEDAVRRAGVDYAQGWLYGRAREVPADEGTISSRGRVKTGALAIRSALDR